MKKHTLPLWALLLVCPFFSTAQKVEKEEATELAKIVFKKFNSGRSSNTKEFIFLGSATKTDIIEADTLLYIVPFDEGGYAIISGDKGVPPYLGYCPKGNFNESDLPPGLAYLIEKYKSEISEIKKEKKQQTEDIKRQWEEIYGQNQLKSVTSNVAPMLDTEWGQKYYGFNDSIPNDYPAV